MSRIQVNVLQKLVGTSVVTVQARQRCIARNQGGYTPLKKIDGWAKGVYPHIPLNLEYNYLPCNYMMNCVL